MAGVEDKREHKREGTARSGEPTLPAARKADAGSAASIDAGLRALAKSGDVIIPRRWGTKLVARVPVAIDAPPLSAEIHHHRR